MFKIIVKLEFRPDNARSDARGFEGCQPDLVTWSICGYHSPMSLTGNSASPSRGGMERGQGLPRWKKVLLTVASCSLLSGAGLKAYGWFSGGTGSGTGSQKVVTDQRNLTGGAAGKTSLKSG